jgi:hypothetical protein
MISCGGSVKQIVESGALRQRSLLNQVAGERDRLAAVRGNQCEPAHERPTLAQALFRRLRQVSPRSWKMAGVGKRRQTKLHA